MMGRHSEIASSAAFPSKTNAPMSFAAFEAMSSACRGTAPSGPNLT
jgi:hypothetical protein